mmetsp:Transcript_33102/g.44822  ORF Transcript_33102/g.44822 Transcript_33102/m.44822 type:complete len:128 (-) Transcript_33102:39-422(-)
MSLSDLFEIHHHSEILEGKEAYACNSDTCCTNRLKVKAERSLRITRVPRILVVTLKRFSYNGGHSAGVKLLTPVQFPVQLTVVEFSVVSSSPVTEQKKEIPIVRSHRPRWCIVYEWTLLLIHERQHD